MSDFTSTPADSGGSDSPVTITITVSVVLGSIIVLLVVALVVSACLFLKKRRKLCFRERYYDDVKPILQGDKEHGAKAGKKGWPFEKKKKKPTKQKNKKRKSKAKYHSLGRAPRFPKSDPFANVFLENPLADHDDFEEDWSNPLFDTEQAALRDAAITIQSWYRMVR